MKKGNGWSYAIVLGCLTFLIGYFFIGNNTNESSVSASDITIFLPVIKWIFPAAIAGLVAGFLSKSDLKLFQILKWAFLALSFVFSILTAIELINVGHLVLG